MSEFVTTEDLPVGAKVAVNSTGAANGATEFEIAEQVEGGFTYRTMEGHSGRNLRMVRKHEHIALADAVSFTVDGWINLVGLSERKASRYLVSPFGFPGVKIA